jgi:hypothetical protein
MTVLTRYFRVAALAELGTLLVLLANLAPATTDPAQTSQNLDEAPQP